MPSVVLFSNASFQEPAQSTVLRSLESAKRKVMEDDTLKLYESHCSKLADSLEKKEECSSSKSILASVDDYVENKIVNTIVESQSSITNVSCDLKPLVKKRKLKIIPNEIEETNTVVAKNKTINFMTKVSKYQYLYNY
jgi:hypothetical protein